MSQVMNEVKQLCLSTKADNLEGVCMNFFISMIYLFFVISGPFLGLEWLHFMQAMSS
jgi:hypothetical protein